MYFDYFVNHLPLEKDMSLYLNKYESSLRKDILWVYDSDDDGQQILIWKAHLSLRLRWTKNPLGMVLPPCTSWKILDLSVTLIYS